MNNNPLQPPEGTYQPQPQPQVQYQQPPQYVVQQPQPPQPQYQQPMMQQPYQQPAPMPYPQQPYMQPPVMVSNVNVNVNTKSGPGFLVRALYFIFIGSWLGFFWLNVGYALCMLVVTLPLGLVMLNNLPTVLTLRPRSNNTTSVNVQTVAVQPGMYGAPGVMVSNVNINVGGTPQTSFLVRALYFCFIGWWLGYLWACIGYALCIFIVTLPAGLIMLNRLPMIITLRKN